MKLFISNFPEPLHRLLKVMAAQQSKPLYQLIIELLYKAIQKEDRNENQ